MVNVPVEMFKSLRDLILKKKKDLYIERLVGRGLILGENVNIVGTFFFDPSHCFLITIGNNCVICPNVRLVAHDASTKLYLGYTKIGKITIKENCFLGDSSIVLPSVEIGPNSIIGAGSVVTKNVPAGSIVAGNPAKFISKIDEYVLKIKTESENKTIFSDEYHISNLNKKMRMEILESVENSIGFIV